MLGTLLARDPGIVSAYLFGSVAEGRAHRDSDVNVGILLARGHFASSQDRFDARLRLISRLSADLGRDVDVVILNDAPPQLARRVMAVDHRVLVRDAEADYIFRRLTLSRAADLEPFLRRTRRLKLETLVR